MLHLEVKHEIKLIDPSDPIIVYFSDGHIAYFEGYYHDGYGPNGLKRFCLKRDDEIVFQYDNRLYCFEDLDSEYRVSFMAYTQQLAAEYWEAAKNHYRNIFWKIELGDSHNQFDDRYKFAWCIISDGKIGLDSLIAGKANHD